MSFTYLLLGLGAKIITGLDDVITHVPILSSVAKTRIGQIAFSLGTFCAIAVAIILAKFIASFLKTFLYYNYFLALLFFGLAAAIFFDLFVHKPKKKAEEKLIRYKKIPAKRFLGLFGIGFISSIATVLDDVIVFTPLFVAGFTQSIYAGIGILLATLLEIIVVIFFANTLMKIKYKEEIASAGLVLLGFLLLFRII